MSSAPSFSELGLRPEILRAVTESGYTTPTPIQQQAIPVVLAGKDVMGGAQTGTGKTAGFGLPILHKLSQYANTSPSPARHPVRALILTPTRELAIQVEESIREYGKYTGLRSTVVYGGVDIKQQLAIVRAGVEILVATPGRLLDHIEQKSVYLGQVEIFVLDEADRMLDMGFIPDIKRIMALLPATAKRQNLLFSATFSGEIKKLADELLNQPQLIEVARRNTAAETVDQSAYKVPQEDKRALLVHLVKTRNYWQVLCFVRTKHGASRLARQLEKDGLITSAIHGDKTQAARLEALTAFKDGKLQVLVATDVAARGLDIDHLPVVLNYELPHVPEDYIHRIGRTGRAGASGVAISLVDPAEEKYLSEIEKLLKKKVLVHQPEDYSVEKASIGPRERGERPERTSRTSRTARTDRPDSAAPRAPRAERAERAPRGDVAARPDRQTHDERMREREEAYARNPDQPAAASTHGATTSALAGHVVQRQGARRPVPMLLQRRMPAAAATAEAPAAPVVASPPPAQTLPAAVPAVDESTRTPDAVASSA
jgi:ATP-dependent RNA helicase RhlE